MRLFEDDAEVSVYLSNNIWSELFSSLLTSEEESGCAFSDLSVGDVLYRNDNNGSGAILEVETAEDHPKSDRICSSCNSFLEKEKGDWESTL